MAPGTKISEVMAKPVQMLPITIFPVASGPPAAAAVAPAPRPAPVNMSRERAAVITQVSFWSGPCYLFFLFSRVSIAHRVGPFRTTSRGCVNVERQQVSCNSTAWNVVAELPQRKEIGGWDFKNTNRNHYESVWFKSPFPFPRRNISREILYEIVFHLYEFIWNFF